MATSPAKIYTKTAPGPDEKVCIFYPRSGVSYPFEATNWLDLRVGFFLSVCSAGGDDTITGLTETISVTPVEPDNSYWIGIKSRGENLPLTTSGESFIGFSDVQATHDHGTTKLVSSDLGITNSPTDYWRPYNSESAISRLGGIFDGTLPSRASWTDGVQLHLVQNFAGGHAAGYATLLAFRFTRPVFGSKAITVQTYTNLAHSGDILFSSTPTLAVLKAQLEAFPTQVQQLGPITLSAVPDALFLYWPFTLSRLRCHSMGFVQIR